MESQVFIEKSLMTVWPERLSVHGTEEAAWAESQWCCPHEVNCLTPNLSSFQSLCSFQHYWLDGHGNLLIPPYLFMWWTAVNTSLQLEDVFKWLVYLADDLSINMVMLSFEDFHCYSYISQRQTIVFWKNYPCLFCIDWIFHHNGF